MFDLLSFFKRQPTPIEAIAGLRDQVIEIGTAVRFLEADRLKPQARDAGGRYVSSKPNTKAMLERLYAEVDDKVLEAARFNAMRKRG